jgi:RimJ/RimL family protein N-acetyltransferase
MTPEHVSRVLDVQQPGSVVCLGEVFPQDAYPFPRDDIGVRWLEEIAAADIDCFVVVEAGQLLGFAAVRSNEFLHFGIAIEHWGTGIAQWAHDAVLGHMRDEGARDAWLRVFTENRRGRRFYEKLGWTQTEERTRSGFPPHPELLRYERGL